MIILFIIFAVCNILMMETRSHWDRVFAHWFPPGKDQWWNPAISWKNKYRTNPYWNWVFCNPLIWTTDFWHFLQTIGLTSIFLLILLLENDLKWWQYGIEVIVLFCVWGFLMWLIMTIFGWISDKWESR
jgi:hypothetical protein